MPLSCWSCSGQIADGGRWCGYCGVVQGGLDDELLPPGVRRFVELAVRWGISDDGYRTNAVASADIEDLLELTAALDSADADAIGDWLVANTTSDAANSPEYQALTCLIMSGDAARLRLRRLHPPPSL